MDDLLIVDINGKLICVKGVGRLFYQEGFPITMAIQELSNKGVQVSLLHVADELLKHGWSPETTLKKLRNDAMEGINKEYENTDWESLRKFSYASYEDQRDMINKYLFKDEAEAKEWVYEKITDSI